MCGKIEARLKAATKAEKAEIVIRNGKIIDVFTLTVYEADVAITDGFIVGIGQYDGIEVIDAMVRTSLQHLLTGMYILNRQWFHRRNLPVLLFQKV